MSTFPIIKSMDELANFIATFWINMLEVGRFEMPFKGDDKISNLANMIRFTQVAEDNKIFSPEQVETIQQRTRKIVEAKLLRMDGLAVYTKFTSPTGYLEEIFAGMNIPDNRWPFDRYTRMFKMWIDYENALKEMPERCGGEEGIKEIMKTYPYGASVFCTRATGERWQIIAAINP